MELLFIVLAYIIAISFVVIAIYVVISFSYNMIQFIKEACFSKKKTNPFNIPPMPRRHSK